MNKKIGILGGGQLARMLVLKTHNMGLGKNLFVYSESADDPAALVTSNWQKGLLNSEKQLKKFIDQMDVIGFESEFIDCLLLEKISKQNKVNFIPSLKNMTKLQDRLSQKKSFLKNALPTADFISVNNYISLIKAFSQLNQGKGIVLKKRMFGYDGFGTFIIKSIEDLEDFSPQLNNPHGFIAETFIPFKRELALIAVRNHRKEIVFLPLCETQQVEAQCFSVHGPIKKNISTLKKKIKNYLNSINYQGVIAFELFETPSNLLINEIAPRLHNSGHFSQEALETDQFLYQLLCLNKQSLPPIKLLSPAYAMVNLVGSHTKPPQISKSMNCHIHWYDKKENRPRRKMGHFTILDKSPQISLKKALIKRKDFKL